MIFYGWRMRVWAMVIVLSLYLAITGIMTVSRLPHNNNNIQFNSVTTSNGQQFMQGGPQQSRNLAPFVPSPRITPRRLRSRIDHVIEWCLPLRMRPEPGPTVALASFPGSGNTWLRYLVQQSTGLLTGSVYKDYALLRNGFPAESVVNGSVVLVKTHEYGADTIQTFDRLVLLVRDPFEALLAEFNRRSGGHVGHAPAEKYKRNNGKYWRTFVESKAEEWVIMNEAWFNSFRAKDRLVMLYDDLVNRTEEQVRNLLSFLNLNPDPDIMKCAMSRKEGIYKRSKKPYNFDVFDSEMRALLNEKISTLYSRLGLPERQVERISKDLVSNEKAKVEEQSTI